MNTIDHLIAAMIAYLRAANGLVATDTIIRSDRMQVKPAPPFLTLKVILADIPLGLTPQVTYRADGTTEYIWERSSRMSVQGFGQETYTWLETAVMLLGDRGLQALNESNFVTIRELSGMRNVSSMLDTAIEQRWSRDFALDYKLINDVTAFTPATQVLIENIRLERYAGAPDAIVDTITVTF